MKIICNRCGKVWNSDAIEPINVGGEDVNICPDCLMELIKEQEEMTDDEYEADLKAQRADEEYDRRKVEGF